MDRREQADELFTENFWETGMRQCLFYSFYLKGNGVKPGDLSRCPYKLPWVDGKRFSNPGHVGAGECGRLMDMPMKRKKRLISFNEGFDGSASCWFSSFDEIQSGPERGRMHDINRSP